MTGQTGVGQQDPHDTTSDFNKHSFLIRQMLSRISTMKVVKVLAVYGADGKPAGETGLTGITGSVDVQIMTKQVDGDGNSMSHGVINNVPFVRMQGGSNAVVCDPEVGQLGMMVVADRDITAVTASRDEANPGSFRQFDAADGIFVGGIVNDAPKQWIRFVKDGMEWSDMNGNTMQTTPDGMKYTDKSGSVLELKDGGMTLKPAGGTVTVDGNMAVVGTLTALSGTGSAVGLTTHIHPQQPDSHGDTEQDTEPPIPGT